jgi:hypothetical protein
VAGGGVKAGSATETIKGWKSLFRYFFFFFFFIGGGSYATIIMFFFIFLFKYLQQTPNIRSNILLRLQSICTGLQKTTYFSTLGVIAAKFCIGEYIITLLLVTLFGYYWW